MLSGDKSLISESYWQVAKDYKGRVLRLSILITILTILIVSTVPSTYLGTVMLTFSPLSKTAISSVTDLSGAATVEQQKIDSTYQRLLSQNIAEGVLIKLRKFKLMDLDNELEKMIAGNVVIAGIKQKMRTVLPFMPQHELNVLSSKQLRMLKNNYTLEQLTQNLKIRYSSNKKNVYVDYQDQNAAFAIIIAKLAADLYVPSVAVIRIQMFDSILQQIKQADNRGYPIPDASDAIYHKFHIPDLEHLIKFKSQQIKQLRIQANEFVQKRQDMTFIQSKVRQYGLNIAPLLGHKQVVEHPLIQAHKRNVEIAEMKLSELTWLPESLPSEVASAKEAMLLEKQKLARELTMFASNINVYVGEVRYEVSKLWAQVKAGRRIIQNLTRIKKDLNQLSPRISNHQTRQLQDKLNQVANIASEQLMNRNVLINNYTTKLLEWDRWLIVIVSFFLSLLVTVLLVMSLVYLKSIGRQEYPSPLLKKSDR